MTTQVSTDHQHSPQIAFLHTRNIPPFCLSRGTEAVYKPAQLTSRVLNGEIHLTGVWPNGRSGEENCSPVSATFRIPAAAVSPDATTVDPELVEYEVVRDDIFAEGPESVELTPPMMSGLVASLGESIRKHSSKDHGINGVVEVNAPILHSYVGQQAKRVVDSRVDVPLAPCVTWSSEPRGTVSSITLGTTRTSPARVLTPSFR